MVLPAPDLENNFWQKTTWDDYNPWGPPIDYCWKKIDIYVGIEEKTEIINIMQIDKNIYYVTSDDVVNFSLFDVSGRPWRYFRNERIIDLNDLQVGIYFLVDNNNQNKIKLIKN